MKKIYRYILCTFMCVSVIFTCSAIISAKTQVPKVTGVKVTSTKATKVTLKWKKLSGVTGYRIYRYNANKKKYVYIGKTKKITFTNSSLTAGKTYKYKVRAYKTKNNKNTYGAYSDVKKAVTTPKKVKGLKTTYLGTSNVKLSWNKTKGASGYEIFLYDSEKKMYVSKGTVSKNSCVLKNLDINTQYKVKIAAFHKKDGKVYGLKSSALTFRTKIPEITSFSLQNVTDSSYTLKWNSVRGATGYELSVYDSQNGWKKVKASADTSYTADNLDSGSSLVYRVRAYAKNGSKYNYSDYSAQLTACTLPETPTELSAATDNRVIRLSWKGVGKATGYEISRFNNDKNLWETIGKAQTDTYTDDTLTKTGTYTYRVRAYVQGDKVYATGYTPSVSLFFESSYEPEGPYEEDLAAAGLVGFLYDAQEGCWYTASDPWQRRIGYTEIFDIFAPGVAIDFDTARIKFEYKNKDWMVQLWKGQYGLVFYGAEIGVYTKPMDRDIDHYDCASDDEMLKMSMDFYRNGVKKFSRPFGSYWWCTGFTPGNVFGAFHTLRVDARIVMKDYEMLAAFKKALDSEELSSKGIIYDTNGLSVYISYQ